MDIDAEQLAVAPGGGVVGAGGGVVFVFGAEMLGVATEAGEVEPEVGARLLDEADIVIDLCTPAADALWRLEGLAETPVGPGSTIAAVAVADAIKVRTAELLPGDRIELGSTQIIFEMR